MQWADNNNKTCVHDSVNNDVRSRSSFRVGGSGGGD